MKKTIIITGVSFLVGMAEALIYYNMGQNSDEKESFKFKIPDGKDLLKTAGVVILTSIVTGFIAGRIESKLNVN